MLTITTTIVGDSVEELRKDIAALASILNVPPAEVIVRTPDTVIDTANITPVEPPSADAEPEPATKTAEKTPESPAEPEAKESTPACISEAQAAELRALCAKFCAADASGKDKIKAYLKEHEIPRITALPEDLFEEFKAMVAA